MGSLELLSYFWSLNTILVVKIENFDFDGLSPPLQKETTRLGETWEWKTSVVVKREGNFAWSSLDNGHGGRDGDLQRGRKQPLDATILHAHISVPF